MTDWVKKLNTPYVNVGTFLVLQQVAKFIGIDNPAYLNPLRYLYLGAQLLIFGLNFYIIHVIKTKNGKVL
jgi:hypothetical protein